MLDAQGEAGAALRGTVAIANAAAAYGAFDTAFRGPRWDALAARGAQVQRPLWASTSTKDPKYPDTYYVEALVADRTVNTLPPDTFAAYRDHGHPNGQMAAHVHGAEAQLGRLAAAGIALAEVTDFLERDGVQKFAASYQALLDRIQAKAGELVRTA
jgi:transaldolase